MTRDHNMAPGDLLAERYELREELGSGGFAVVWMAFDRKLERQVAVKVLWPHLLERSRPESQQACERFLREARAAARIRHSAIVEIHDVGTVDDASAPFIVMERLHGHSLAHQLDTIGPLSARRLFPMYADLLEGLHRGHLHGIIHKDLKPANLFLCGPDTDDEMLKVVDFGIAHVDTPRQDRLTSTGSLVGTPQYLPPEYLEEQQVSPAMDIYQAGLTLVELLSGQPMVQNGPMFSAAIKHVERDFSVDPDSLDGEFGELVRRAIAVEPDGRFDSARQFAAAIRQLDPADIPVLAPDGEPQEFNPVSPFTETAPDIEQLQPAPSEETPRNHSTDDAPGPAHQQRAGADDHTTENISPELSRLLRWAIAAMIVMALLVVTTVMVFTVLPDRTDDEALDVQPPNQQPPAAESPADEPSAPVDAVFEDATELIRLSVQRGWQVQLEEAARGAVESDGIESDKLDDGDESPLPDAEPASEDRVRLADPGPDASTGGDDGDTREHSGADAEVEQAVIDGTEDDEPDIVDGDDEQEDDEQEDDEGEESDAESSQSVPRLAP